MSIESLMSAADAAGYVMVSEEELPETFGKKPSLFDFKSVPSTAVAIWRPVVPSIDGQPVSNADVTNNGPVARLEGSAVHAWSWLTGRFSSGAAA